MTAEPRGPTATLAPFDEREIIARCRGGDSSAFDAIVERYQQRVFTLCYWMLKNRDDAEDAAQEAFLRAYRGLASFRGDCAFSTWIHRIAVNAALDFGQRRSKAPLALSSLQHDDESEMPEPVSPGEGPADQAQRRERRRAVLRALHELPEQQRAMIVLFDIQGHSYEEIAALLELPLGTVKSRLNRARLAMRDRLDCRRELFFE